MILLILIFVTLLNAMRLPKEIIFPAQPPIGLQVTWNGCREAEGCNVQEKLSQLVPYFNTVAAFFRPKIAIGLLPQGKKMKSLEDPAPETVTIPEEPPEGCGLTIKADECSTETGCNARLRNMEIGKYFNILASHFSQFSPESIKGPHDTSFPMPVQSVNIPQKKINQAKLTAQHKNDIRNMLNQQNKQIYDSQKPMLNQMYQNMANQQMTQDAYHNYIQKIMGLEQRRQSMFSNYLKTRNNSPHFEDMYSEPTKAPSTNQPADHELEVYGGNYFTNDGYKIMKKRHLENLGLNGYGKSAFTPSITGPLITK
ncbi:hypothetical protein ENUP19_0216G0023 [Entamoeba nuttalli]|uniref:Uncharacterized protein n=2 Tax=Entamoeba nuttalli TaxID=412467 RepID=K2H2L7_ENTNP|nr:hypothetical protein ENU1_046270 [Entamoeba nuttalli P19]EKE41743.1 hypothetical protein ENU1_046270 [Entamoeba nuttalli P19]|eukprot:XP_008855925.1 hypothetical protein ENU1_046270 [Entamoeba nuttalli P19]